MRDGHGTDAGRTDGRTDRRMDGVKPIYPPTTSLCRGIMISWTASSTCTFPHSFLRLWFHKKTYAMSNNKTSCTTTSKQGYICIPGSTYSHSGTTNIRTSGKYLPTVTVKENLKHTDFLSLLFSWGDCWQTEPNNSCPKHYLLIIVYKEITLDKNNIQTTEKSNGKQSYREPAMNAIGLMNAIWCLIFCTHESWITFMKIYNLWDGYSIQQAT